MINSKNAIYALLLTGAVICGCTQEDNLAVNEESKEVVEETANVRFQLLANTSPTTTTRSVEDSYNHIQGTADEQKVNNARVYLFDAPTKLFVKSFQLTNLTRKGTDEDGNIIYETEHVAVPQGTYDIFAVANTDRKINTNNEDEFLADIDSITYKTALITDISKGIVMTNRGADNAATVIMKQQNNTDNVVVISLERVLARLDVAKSEESFALTDKNSKQYATVTLDGYYIVNCPKYYYSFRHTAVLNSMNVPNWNISENFGIVKDVDGYVIDPYFFNKTIDASNFTNSDKYYEFFFGDYSHENTNSITWTAFKPVSTTPQYNTVYTLENCCLAPAQKNGYSTGVVFKAKVEPYNNVFQLSANGNMELITDKSLYPEVLYYYDYKFYNSPSALAAAIGISSVSGVMLDQYKVKKFEKTDEGYRCYYTYWIRHLDNYKDTTMGVMEFAIVRNNLYRMLITNVSDLGNTELAPNTDTPDEGETYLKVVLNVKPWIVRELTNIVL